MERNEAIESLRQLYFDTNAENKAALECLIPELKESEDERIRKALIDEIKVWDEHYKLFKHVSKEKVLAYLEKQKEHKPELCDMGRWDEESYNNGIHHVLQNPKEYGLTKQNPAEWSEEDKEMLDAMMDMVSNALYEPLCPRAEMLAWLKVLRDRPTK